MSFLSFINQLTHNLPFTLIVLVNIGVILVNGWTDAANSIATCIGTRSMRPAAAIFMSSIFNFLGVFVMTIFNATVAETIYNMVDFRGSTNDALAALFAAMVSIVIWAVAAWFFGINTSESHALIAGVSGAAIALQGGFSGINGSEWMKVIYGLAMSTVLGFAFGYVVAKATEFICKNMNRGKTTSFFKGAQIVSAAGMSFMHGAQDGQKFMGVFMLGMFLSMGKTDEVFSIPIWLMILCSVVISLGTAIGGYKIIKKMGLDIVKLEKYQGFAVDFASTLSLFLTSIWGIPVSTSHMKATAIIGVGASKRLSAINWRQVREIALAWVLTFPGCGLIGYGMSLLFIRLY
ncbi:MAG: inorganic phosphate transporter [Oscillospiraceae bacterium]|nr:inorganic phosphate transporter [Oscillospiraceae bacterium]